MQRRSTWPAILVLVVGCGAPGTSAVPPASSEPRTAALATPAPTATPSATTQPSMVPPTSAPTPDPTAFTEPTVDPEPEPTQVACPVGSPLGVREFLDARLSCFGSDDVAIRAWLDTPPTFGFIGPVVRPMWLYYPPDGTYFTLFSEPPEEPDHLCGGCMFLHLPPDSTIELGGPARWVIATGHRKDPAAATCHYDEPADWVGPEPDDAGARAGCRGSFVLVGLEDAAAP
jgi:hypothetical protein